MIRGIIAVIVSYVAMALMAFICFTAMFLVLGPDGSFEPGTYKLSMVWMLVSYLVVFIATIIGGWICIKVGKTWGAVTGLIVLCVVFGAMDVKVNMDRAEEQMNTVRPEGESMSNIEAMQSAQSPMWFVMTSPIVYVVGVLIGARIGGCSNQSVASETENP